MRQCSFAIFCSCFFPLHGKLQTLSFLKIILKFAPHIRLNQNTLLLLFIFCLVAVRNNETIYTDNNAWYTCNWSVTATKISSKKIDMTFRFSGQDVLYVFLLAGFGSIFINFYFYLFFIFYIFYLLSGPGSVGKMSQLGLELRLLSLPPCNLASSRHRRL